MKFLFFTHYTQKHKLTVQVLKHRDAAYNCLLTAHTYRLVADQSGGLHYLLLDYLCIICILVYQNWSKEVEGKTYAPKQTNRQKHYQEVQVADIDTVQHVACSGSLLSKEPCDCYDVQVSLSFLSALSIPSPFLLFFLLFSLLLSHLFLPLSITPFCLSIPHKPLNCPDR